jgi:transcriptional regulator EpsA
MRAIEGTAEVRRRHQFFNWLLSRVGSLVPNQLAICGAWSPAHKALSFDQFNSILVPERTLNQLTGRPSSLLRCITDEWQRRAVAACCLPVAGLQGAVESTHIEDLAAIGIRQLLVHGVSRPQRADAIETIFVFASPGVTVDPGHLRALELIGPHLHLTYLRMLSFEASLGQAVTGKPPPSAVSPGEPRLLTRRELEILALVRDGLSNAQIGMRLGISPLTAKNHIQGLLRKLGASNRAQAVAHALALEMLPGADVQAASSALHLTRQPSSATAHEGPHEAQALAGGPLTANPALPRTRKPT